MKIADRITDSQCASSIAEPLSQVPSKLVTYHWSGKMEWENVPEHQTINWI